MANTLVLIASSNVGSGGAANVDFTSIPSTYTDLLVMASMRITTGSTAAGFTLRFNNNTSNYTQKRLFGTGSGVVADSSGESLWVNGSTSTSSTFSNVSIYIPNYASNNAKSYSNDGILENNASEAYQALVAGLWNDTSAITSVKITSGSATFAQYTSFYLYGIKSS